MPGISRKGNLGFKVSDYLTFIVNPKCSVATTSTDCAQILHLARVGMSVLVDIFPEESTAMIIRGIAI